MNHTCISEARNLSVDPLGGHQAWEVVLIVLVTGPLSLVTILGNLLVVISFRVNSQLRTISNYYLLSLAVADLILGTVSMNLYTVYIIMGRWTWGHLACDLWLALDYVASNASVMNLLVISFDRYFSVTRPLTYRTKRTPKKAAAMIALAWVVSFVLWGPAILFWPHVVGRSPEAESQDCSIPFLKVPPLTYSTAMAAFYLPVTIMIILYWRIYWEIENRAKGLAGFIGTVKKTRNTLDGLDKQFMYQASTNSCSKERNSKKVKEKSEGTPAGCFPGRQSSPNSLADILRKSAHESYKEAYSNSSWNIDDEDDGALSSSTEDEHEQSIRAREPSSNPAVIKLKDLQNRSEVSSGVQEHFTKATNVSAECPTPHRVPKTARRSDHVNCHQPRAKHRISTIIREKKAARTLSAILLAFILTWTPYNIMVLASISYCVPEKLWQLGYWLCYVNSTVNPICYALCNESFRVTFKALLLCRCGNKRKWDTSSWTRHASARQKKSSSTV
ncbi:muscarinic acetylcholine receptor M1 [Triplophysa rosa]|uniref:Muscarinic acetylcholine receptor n=1 Tax=Triplophysa rosa TaxID=992332 RepID=A0A9W8CAR9_TRIRA|nr:muscarinic acetylcholine receptor M1 [Triplophysa rosa]KAI7812639.1 putative muscarinic acetylcholine receptor M1 [Triplophysa rosa]